MRVRLRNLQVKVIRIKVKVTEAKLRSTVVCLRDESMLGIPMGPMGIPWEWKSLMEIMGMGMGMA